MIDVDPATGARLTPMKFIFGGKFVVGEPVMRKEKPITLKHTEEDSEFFGQMFEITHPDTGKKAAVLYHVVADYVPGLVGAQNPINGSPKTRCQLMYMRRNKKSLFHFPVEANSNEQCVNRSVMRGESRFDLYELKGMSFATKEDVVRILDMAEANTAEAAKNKRAASPVDVMAQLLEMVQMGITNTGKLADAKAHAAEVERAEKEKGSKK
jgi:hypothetical protein